MIDSFLRGRDLGLVSINKLFQLRKYIFDIEIKRSQFQQNFLLDLKLLLGLIKLFRSKVYHTGINRSYDSLIERNRKGYVAAILKRLRITEVMSKPNDSK